MIDENKIIEEARVYISNNKTIEETAIELGLTKKTLINHLKKLKDINEDLYNQVQAKKNRNLTEGRITGGKIGKATSNYTKEEVEKLALLMINNKFSYREAAQQFNIPKSTIYEILHSGLISEEIIKELDILADDNQHNPNSASFLSGKK